MEGTRVSRQGHCRIQGNYIELTAREKAFAVFLFYYLNTIKMMLRESKSMADGKTDPTMDKEDHNIISYVIYSL